MFEYREFNVQVRVSAVDLVRLQIPPVRDSDIPLEQHFGHELLVGCAFIDNNT